MVIGGRLLTSRVDPAACTAGDPTVPASNTQNRWCGCGDSSVPPLAHGAPSDHSTRLMEFKEFLFLFSLILLTMATAFVISRYGIDSERCPAEPEASILNER